MMSLDIGPIASSLTRNFAGSLLVVLQVAIALAVLANSAWIIEQRSQTLSKRSGVDDKNIFAISSAPVNERYEYQASLKEDLAYLRGLKGVVSASPADAIPFSRTGFSTDAWANPDQKGKPETLNALSMDEQGLHALGGKLLSGREFRADEIGAAVSGRNITDFVPQVIITRVAADALFPKQDALGKTIYDSVGKPAVITGIMANMTGSVPRGLARAEHVVLFPRLPAPDRLIYVVRTEVGQRDTLLQAAAAHLAANNPNRVIKYARPLEQYKRRLYLADSNMQIFLSSAVALVLFITCLGLFGIASFNVNARTRQMGTRRALGARRRDILSYYLVENAILTGVGLLLGCVLGLGAGYWLSSQYGTPPLNVYYLLLSVPLLWVIGQLAVWIPARRASGVAPAEATRAQ
jgi:putative ABC transport system permease protein